MIVPYSTRGRDEPHQTATNRSSFSQNAAYSPHHNTAGGVRSVGSFTSALLGTLGIYLNACREEQHLTAELGASYDTYRHRLPMLLPHILGTRTRA